MRMKKIRQISFVKKIVICFVYGSVLSKALLKNHFQTLFYLGFFFTFLTENIQKQENTSDVFRGSLHY